LKGVLVYLNTTYDLAAFVTKHRDITRPGGTSPDPPFHLPPYLDSKIHSSESLDSCSPRGWYSHGDSVPPPPTVGPARLTACLPSTTPLPRLLCDSHSDLIPVPVEVSSTVITSLSLNLGVLQDPFTLTPGAGLTMALTGPGNWPAVKRWGRMIPSLGSQSSRTVVEPCGINLATGKYFTIRLFPRVG